jgi:hypothetical protein
LSLANVSFEYSGIGSIVPVHGFGLVVFGFQRRSNVSIHPEGPKGVIEVEDD